MADTGYFDSVSANLKTGVGAQVKGISEGVKANSEAGVSPSVNALDTGVKAAACPTFKVRFTSFNTRSSPNLLVTCSIFTQVF